jgi:uncharacterized protein YcbK (DUF882 family)
VAPPLSPDLQQFVNHTNSHRELADLQAYLALHDVHDVIPIDQLIKQGTDWQSKQQPKYAIPDRPLWPKMVRTLKLMQRFVIPSVGPVEVVSGFRTEKYNVLAGGARRSKHLEFAALDVIPQAGTDRDELHQKLLAVWRMHGKHLNMGLGLYGRNRFHIDTGGHRIWRG